MAGKNWTIEIKKERGKLVVIGLGKTNRDQRYIRGRVPLTVESIADPKFKSEMAAAVEKINA